MSKATEKENLVKVKLTLAEKYDRLSKVAKSKPKKATWARQAEKHRRQAADAARK